MLAYHIPLGVLIFFLAYRTLALTFGLRFEISRTQPATRESVEAMQIG